MKFGVNRVRYGGEQTMQGSGRVELAGWHDELEIQGEEGSFLGREP